MLTLPDNISPNILGRWFDPENKEDKDKSSNEMSSGFFLLRKAITKILLESVRDEDKKEISPNHQDKAVRLACYENTSPAELFQTSVFDKNFKYPSWQYLREYPPDDSQKKFVSACEKYFALDKNDFIDSLIYNLSFWERKQERELLHNLSWNLAEDKHSSMDVPNSYRRRESYMLNKYPQFFNDDDFSDVPEELSWDDKIEKINEQLIARIEMIEKKQLSSSWMWLIIFLLILILLTKH